ncbi:hypothetical protein [Azospirillum sp. SYSU D00513]|uniref:hypothetical protein n=1 Tax=Azospirillum sp. SYSU D00513 TaxID=2812561 RepID=UPI001A972608|nr:hypothetical protein [Azospirillum sp. SYSU D00513]
MKFIKPFRGVKAGEIYPTEFKPGDTCPDELAGAAEALGALEEAKPAPKSKTEKTEG